MKYLCFILIIVLNISCNGQAEEEKKKEIYLSITPLINQTDPVNQEIIKSLELFLKTKNNSLADNEFWKKSDFEKYVFPYFDLYKIERSKHGDNHFKPSLMEIMPTDEENKKMIKIGFVGHDDETNENVIKCIYNIIATKTPSGILFERALNYNIKTWQKVKHNSITYHISNSKNPNQKEIERQAKEIKDLCQFLETEPIDISYYSCVNPIEVFKIRGFDYTPNMYFSTTGGMIARGDIVYSGNNSEYYTHEIVHIYTFHLFPNMDQILNEGLATYIGGSGKFNYEWHRKKMKRFLKKNPTQLEKHLTPYERFYIDDETPVPYMIGAIICERINRVFGKEKLFEIFKSEKDFWGKMEMIGLTQDNFTKEIQGELDLSLTFYLKKNNEKE